MIKITNKITQNAKLPYEICKGSEKDRNKLAHQMFIKFCKELDKDAIDSVCSADGFVNSINSILEPHKINFKLTNSENTKSYGTLTTQYSTLTDGKNIIIQSDGFEIQVPLCEDNQIIIDKYCAAHEVRHLLDHILNPKITTWRFHNQINHPQYMDTIDEINKKFLIEFDNPVNIKKLKSDTREQFSKLPDEISIEVLQRMRHQLKSEINAYNDEIIYLKKGFGYIKNLLQIKLIKNFLKNNAKFQQKLDFINELLREKLINARNTNKEHFK